MQPIKYDNQTVHLQLEHTMGKLSYGTLRHVGWPVHMLVTGVFYACSNMLQPAASHSRHRSPPHAYPMLYRQTVTGLSWSRNGRFLASGSADHSLILWDVLQGTQVRPHHLCCTHLSQTKQPKCTSTQTSFLYLNHTSMHCVLQHRQCVHLMHILPRSRQCSWKRPWRLCRSPLAHPSAVWSA